MAVAMSMSLVSCGDDDKEIIDGGLLVFGVEPEETENKKIYFHYGFTEHIKNGVEVYPDGTEIDVEYYGKNLKEDL